ENCYSLTSITIPDGVISIGNHAFANCPCLKYANLGSDAANTLSRAGYSFRVPGYQYNLRYLYATNNTINGMEISGVDNDVTMLVIPDGVTVIGDYAFDDCTSLTSVAIPDGVTSIGYRAFWNCGSLTNISIPDSVTSIGQYAFGGDHWYWCGSLKTIYMSENVTSFDGIYFPEDATIYCREFSEADYWATNAGYNVVYVDGSFSGVDCIITLPASLRMERGTERQIVPGLFPPTDNADIAWSSSAPGIVSVAQDGTITALAKGAATITAAWGDASASMEVDVYIRVTNFTLPAEAWVAAKGTLELVPLIEPADGEITLTWSSDNTVYATVNDDGIVSGKRPGESATIVASGNGITRPCTVHVCYPVASIAFASANAETAVGDVFQAEANVTTTGSENFVNKLVTFSSSNEDVARVDAMGRVIGISDGSVVITATASNGKTASFTIMVTEAAPLATLYLPASLTAIEAEAFRGNTAIGAVYVPAGCASIGDYAFADCTGLRAAHIPAGVTIADNAFDGCGQLTIYCPAGSAAQAFATAHGLTCVTE
ncbi:MAG: leucine-rich repeat protein, partial [Clostridia bacterium]|nr:leucine-rich repeat protein [Clostridia bacterium]